MKKVIVCLLIGCLAVTLSVYVPQPARAAPQSTHTFTVNSTSDSTSTGVGMTLRKAILLANGGTGAGGLNRALTAAERAQTTSCAFDSSNFIVGGCGTGITDTIGFTTTLGTFPSITLTASLPAINDTAPTTLDGGSIWPVINAASIGAGHDGLRILSDHNTVSYFSLNYAPRYSVYISGNHNWAGYFIARNAGSDAVYMSGSNNMLYGAGLGVYSIFATSCVNNSVNSANGGYGLRMDAGASNNLVKAMIIGCNSLGGVHVSSTAGTGNTIGPDNAIGTNTNTSAALGNSGMGVSIASDWNSVITNTIVNNVIGLGISGNWNIAGGNVIRINISDGVYLYSGASYNGIGVLGILGPASLNLIGGNTGYGVEMGGSTTSNNFLVDACIGCLNDTVAADPNGLGGIRINAARDNNIGDSLFPGNVVINNSGDGLRLDNGAHDNVVHNSIFGYVKSGNAGNGISLQGGSHDNTIGGSGGNKVAISGNALNGVAIFGSSTTSNTVDAVDPYSNTLNGILIDAAASNTLVNNLISANLGNGIVITHGATNTHVVDDFITTNGANGIELGGTGTYANVISETTATGNHFDGVNERHGAYNNLWTYLDSYGNSGMGIDKNAPVDVNDTPSAPFAVITGSYYSAGNYTVAGTAIASSPGAFKVKVELYAVKPNHAGVGDGWQYQGSAVVDTKGHWSLVPVAPGCFTAFETITDLTTGAFESTEFGPSSCRVLLPMIVR